MSQSVSPRFDQVDLYDLIETLDEAGHDRLDFGAIGFDSETVVRLYNTFESTASGLSPPSVLGKPLFTVVAPCMNNFLVAQRFEDAESSGEPLDATIDYVLTLRMKPIKVKLRLLAGPTRAMRYVLIQRRS